MPDADDRSGASVPIEQPSYFGVEALRTPMRLLVLLSSWNGAAYIRDQIASILNQSVDGDLRLLIRDDGSSDDTVSIVQAFGDRRIELIQGERLGAKGSFLTLLKMARDREPEFVALADQDDVWLPQKMAHAIARLDTLEQPALYGSALNVVDAQLRPLGKYAFTDQPNFEGAALANCMTGCTCVLNRHLLELLEPLPNANEILMHDWWLYLVCATFGEVIYDSESQIYYRQHASNQVGIHSGGIDELAYRTRNLVKRRRHPNRLSQVREFLRLYSARLSRAQREYLEALIACERGLFDRLRFAVWRRPHRQRKLDELACLAQFAMGWF